MTSAPGKDEPTRSRCDACSASAATLTYATVQRDCDYWSSGFLPRLCSACLPKAGAAELGALKIAVRGWADGRHVDPVDVFCSAMRAKLRDTSPDLGPLLHPLPWERILGD